MSPQTRLFRTILCPVDFSKHSRHALRYAALLAARYRSRLVAIFIEDPMLAAAAAFAFDDKTLLDEGRIQLQRFVEQTASAHGITGKATTIDVTVGKPHEEILRASKRFKCDLIVMGSHGLTGVSRMMFGSTTHRVLRESSLPILATPPVVTRSSGISRNWPGKRRLHQSILDLAIAQMHSRPHRSLEDSACSCSSFMSWSLFPTSRGSSSTKRGGIVSAIGRLWRS